MDGNDGDNDDDEASEEADAPLEGQNTRWVHLLAGVVTANQDYSLGLMVPLPDATVAAPVAFKVVELQALTFFALCLLMHASRFLEENLLIYFCFLC